MTLSRIHLLGWHLQRYAPFYDYVATTAWTLPATSATLNVKVGTYRVVHGYRVRGFCLGEPAFLGRPENSDVPGRVLCTFIAIPPNGGYTSTAFAVYCECADCNRPAGASRLLDPFCVIRLSEVQCDISRHAGHRTASAGEPAAGVWGAGSPWVCCIFP